MKLIPACEPLVQPSKDGNEPLTQKVLHHLQYSQCQLNTVDKAAVSHSNANMLSLLTVVTLCIQPSAINWFHTCITVKAACPVRA